MEQAYLTDSREMEGQAFAILGPAYLPITTAPRRPPAPTARPLSLAASLLQRVPPAAFMRLFAQLHHDAQMLPPLPEPLCCPSLPPPSEPLGCCSSPPSGRMLDML